MADTEGAPRTKLTQKQDTYHKPIKIAAICPYYLRRFFALIAGNYTRCQQHSGKVVPFSARAILSISAGSIAGITDCLKSEILRVTI